MREGGSPACAQSSGSSQGGLPPEELLDFYLQAQDPVVTLSARPIARDNARVLELRRHPDTDTLLTPCGGRRPRRLRGIRS